MAPKKISDTGEDEDMKWITLRMAQSHIEELDNRRRGTWFACIAKCLCSKHHIEGAKCRL